MPKIAGIVVAVAISGCGGSKTGTGYCHRGTKTQSRTKSVIMMVYGFVLLRVFVPLWLFHYPARALSGIALLRVRPRIKCFEEQIMQNPRAFVSSLLIVCLAVPLALAKQRLDEWDNVRILQAGTHVIVKTKSGEKYEGEFKEATRDSIEVFVEVRRAMRQIITIRKDEVKEVRKKMSRVTSTAIGSGIGLGAGLALGAIADSKDKYGEDPGLGKAVFGFLGFIFGAGIGLNNSFHNPKVYQAP